MAVIEMIGLGLYLLQQLGMALGVGAETLLLSHRATGADERKTRKVLRYAFFCIFISGILITAAHVAAGEVAVLAQPAFLFKWALLVFVLVGPMFLPRDAEDGLVGATWYALFVLHVVAPVTSWIVLLLSYAVWVALFSTIAYMLRMRAISPEAAPAHSQREPDRFVPPAQPVARKHLAQQPVPKPTPHTVPAVRQPIPFIKPQPAHKEIAKISPVLTLVPKTLRPVEPEPVITMERITPASPVKPPVPQAPATPTISIPKAQAAAPISSASKMFAWMTDGKKTEADTAMPEFPRFEPARAAVSAPAQSLSAVQPPRPPAEPPVNLPTGLPQVKPAEAEWTPIQQIRVMPRHPGELNK